MGRGKPVVLAGLGGLRELKSRNKEVKVVEVKRSFGDWKDKGEAERFADGLRSQGKKVMVVRKQ